MKIKAFTKLKTSKIRFYKFLKHKIWVISLWSKNINANASRNKENVNVKTQD